MRLLIIHNIINPLVIPYFELLARCPRIDLTVWFLAESTSTRHWSRDVPPGIHHEVLRGYTFEFQMEEKLALHFNPSIRRKIRDGHFDAMILFGGWDSPSFWLAAWAAKSFGIPLIVRSGSVPGRGAFGPSPTFLSRFRRLVGRIVARRIVSSADALLAYGSRSARYLTELGANSDRIFKVWNTPDIAAVSQGVIKEKPNALGLREQLGVPTGGVLVLYVGRLQPVKKVDQLIRAYALAHAKASNLVLAIIGYGPCEESLRALAKTTGGAIHFLGRVEGALLNRYYAASDIFVLPSGDIWGLVVNEAMAAGLPVVVADTVGSSDDLVVQGETGFTYSSDDTSELADRLTQLARDSEMRVRMGACAQEHIQHFTYEIAVKGITDAIDRVTKERTQPSPA